MRVTLNHISREITPPTPVSECEIRSQLPRLAVLGFSLGLFGLSKLPFIQLKLCPKSYFFKKKNPFLHL